MKRYTYMNHCGEERTRDAVAIAEYITSNNATVRKTAEYFGCSKSRVHELMTNCLKKEKPLLYEEVKKVFDINKAERHIRGGNATKKKFCK